MSLANKIFRKQKIQKNQKKTSIAVEACTFKINYSITIIRIIVFSVFPRDALYDYTDQAKKKTLFFFIAFRRGKPLARFVFPEQIKKKITYFAEGFLREILWRNSEKVRGETPRHFAEKNLRDFAEELREVL